MAKKQNKITKDKKIVKAVKKTPATAKKTVKSKTSAVSSAKGKPKAGKSQPVKKVVVPTKKQAAPKKVVKPVVSNKKSEVAKPTPKTGKTVIKATVSGSTKKEKEIVKKSSLAVAPLKKKDEKPVKAGKPAKPSKKEKPSKKAKKGGDDDVDDSELDVEIVDTWGVDEDEEVVDKKAAKKSKGGRKPKSKDDDDEPVIENDLLVEQLINSTKKLRKPSSKVPQQIRTFTNPMAALVVAKSEDDKKGSKLPKKEPKGKFELEYVIRTSAGILFEFLTSPSGLAEWFADNVNFHDGVFTFFWDGSEQKAKLLGFKEDKFVKLQWLDKPDGTYFEFRIERDELTGDISLMITDFADEAADMQTSKLLWDSQINKLSHVIGSY
jgi:uncharacterized protein YndB with AHSA1/START domain